MNKYKWKMESLAKGIDPQKAEKELERIQKKYGELTPDTLLNASKSEKALLHSLFEWDNSIAAEKYRLQQARNIINNVEIIIISDGEEKVYSAYEIVPKNESDVRQYKRIDTLTFDEIAFVREITLAQLKQISHKLKTFTEFGKVLEYVNGAIEELQPQE